MLSKDKEKNYNKKVTKLEDEVQYLIKAAMKSELYYKHSASLLYKGTIISTGVNKYFKNVQYQDKIARLSIHAEVMALYSSNQKFTKGMDILIIGIGKTCKLRNSRPCNNCIESMREKGVRKVYYSNSDGDIVYEFLDEMPKIHESSGHALQKSKYFR
uniref:CMP/dCMP-type deaminase domain-containing protein n=1 Tax=viral metagenome TaxID=1070528 RepID=A0A6C0DZS8_9ZZZZ